MEAVFSLIVWLGLYVIVLVLAYSDLIYRLFGRYIIKKYLKYHKTMAALKKEIESIKRVSGK